MSTEEMKAEAENVITEEIKAQEMKEDIKQEKAEEKTDEGIKGESADGKTASDEEMSDAVGTSGESPEETPPKEDFADKYMRLMADFQNYKRRADKEKQDIYAYAGEKLIVKLLDVLDNFERALEQIDSPPSTAPKKEEEKKDSSTARENGMGSGMKMIYAQLTDVLKEAGLGEIEAEGAEFDPDYHEAVVCEDAGADKADKVTAVLKKGYMYNGKVIRHAMVKVGTK